MIARLQGTKVVGAKQTCKSIKSGKVVTVYLAKDADHKIIQPIEELCRQNNVELIYINTMKDLGYMCGIDVGAATAALINE